MKNVYDIKKEKNLNFILPVKNYFSRKTESDILIIIHLHYLDQFNNYLSYVFNIPEVADVIFTTSNLEIEKKLMQYQDYFKFKYIVIKKENRGRDISALLVASKNYILNYKYVCFIHDKKYKDKNTESDTNEFIKTLWENLLGSNAYIYNIIHTFQRNPLLGLLLPPETLSDNFSFVYTNTWDRNYKLMLSLAKKMQLNCNLDSQKKPISLGTAFWARVDALKKLFELNWCYEDFDEEPLADDGTISHAIERSFAYVAQDAGYDTGIVMTDRFAGERFDKINDLIIEAFEMLGKTLNIPTIGVLKKENEIYDLMINFVKNFRKIYIYGAGVYGKRCFIILNSSMINIDGYIVTKKDNNFTKLNGLPVIEFSDISLDDETGIVVAVNENNKKEIVKLISSKYPRFSNIFYFVY